MRERVARLLGTRLDAELSRVHAGNRPRRRGVWVRFEDSLVIRVHVLRKWEVRPVVRRRPSAFRQSPNGSHDFGYWVECDAFLCPVAANMAMGHTDCRVSRAYRTHLQRLRLREAERMP
jgi:hypothetical protein